MHDTAHLTGLARRMVEDGVLDIAVALKAQTDANTKRQGFISYLVRENLASAQDIATSVCTEFGVPRLNLDAISTEAIASASAGVDRGLIQRHMALPFMRKGSLIFVAVADPTNQGLDEIRFQTGMNTEAIVVEYDKLQILITKILKGENNHSKDSHTSINTIKERGLTNLFNTKSDAALSPIKEEEAPTVIFVHKILLSSIKKRASDIHFEPYEKRYRIRFRIDGILTEEENSGIELGGQISSRLKVMANLDIAEKRVPQDGRIRIKLENKKPVDFRINTLPTLWGEKVVLRLLDDNYNHIGIDNLGFNPIQKNAYLRALKKPQGMILVTGPTGSGKTVTLYAGLNILNKKDVNIITVEDPVEINMEGINQVHVNQKVGLSFSTALHAFLRQDPDILMIGEIRDKETAEIAIKASQTGHIVLSTLHTNRATETLTRLKNLGIRNFNIANSISLIISQRLARKLCNKCKEVHKLPKKALISEGFLSEQVDTLHIFKSNGCKHCIDGYKGRVGIHEVLAPSKDLVQLIMAEANVLELSQQANKEGFVGLREVALQKVAQGITSLTEINRVTC